MTTDAELLRIVGSWLEDGRTRLPDHVLDAVLAELPTTTQRRSWWPPRRITRMTPIARFATLAAAATVVAVVGVTVLQPRALDGPAATPGVPPPSSASPSPSPSSAPPTGAPPVGALDAGRYAWPWAGGEVSFEVDTGWTGNAEGLAKITPASAELAFGPFLPGTRAEVTHVYANACQSEGQLQPVGRTVADLVAALDAQIGTDVVTTPLDIGRGIGTRVEIREQPGLDRAACRHGVDGPLQIWADEAESTFYALGQGFWGVVYAFDIDGQRVVFGGPLSAETTDKDVLEIEAIVNSLDFGPEPSGSLPVLDRPGTRASPAGEYGWENGPGPRGQMHKVIGDRPVSDLVFTVGPDCLKGAGEPPVPVHLAGLDGVSIDSYQPPVGFGGAQGDEITRAHAFAVGTRTLCVFLTWYPSTTDDERAAAEAILDTIRAEPTRRSSVRVTFRLDEGWDTG